MLCARPLLVSFFYRLHILCSCKKKYSRKQKSTKFQNYFLCIKITSNINSRCLFGSTSLSTLMYLLLGSDTNITGLRIIREDVARYISRRDGYPADVDDVILINGGAIGIQVRDQYSFYWVAVDLLIKVVSLLGYI